MIDLSYVSFSSLSSLIRLNRNKWEDLDIKTCMVAKAMLHKQEFRKLVEEILDFFARFWKKVFEKILDFSLPVTYVLL